MEKLIITAAICGGDGTKEDNPAIPYTLEELTAEAKAAFEAGASVIHMHVREDDGTLSYDKNRYKEAVRMVKEACPGVIIIQPSAGAAYDFEELEFMDPGKAKDLPEMMTVPAGSCNWGEFVFANAVSEVYRKALALRKHGIVPDLEAFDKGMIDTIIKGDSEGVFEHPVHFDFILGVQMAPNVRDLTFLDSSIPSWATYTATGLGDSSWHIAAAAALLGGHIRVGFEDSLYIEDGVLAKSNGELVSKAAALAKTLGREIATPDEARRILGINKQEEI